MASRYVRGCQEADGEEGFSEDAPMPGEVYIFERPRPTA